MGTKVMLPVPGVLPTALPKMSRYPCVPLARIVHKLVASEEGALPACHAFPSVCEQCGLEAVPHRTNTTRSNSRDKIAFTPAGGAFLLSEVLVHEHFRELLWGQRLSSRPSNFQVAVPYRPHFVGKITRELHHLRNDALPISLLAVDASQLRCSSQRDWIARSQTARRCTRARNIRTTGEEACLGSVVD